MSTKVVDDQAVGTDSSLSRLLGHMIDFSKECTLELCALTLAFIIDPRQSNFHSELSHFSSSHR